MVMMNILKTILAAAAALMITGGVMAQTVQVNVGKQSFEFQLSGSDAAKSFAAQMPLKLKFEDYGSFERIAYLPQNLTLGNAPRACDPKQGDLTYYAPWGNLAVFVKDFRYSENLIPLGKLSSEALEAIQQSGSAEVEFNLVK